MCVRPPWSYETLKYYKWQPARTAPRPQNGLMNAHAVLVAYQSAYAPLRNAERAQAMQDYLRGQFVFMGIAAPQRRAAVHSLLRAARERSELLATVNALWQLPEREYRYAAIDLLLHWKRWLTPTDIPWLLTLANQEPWWETVDGIASVVSKVLLASHTTGGHNPALMQAALGDPSLWTRRIAMTHQLGWKQYTDAATLFRYALTLAPETEFFIRKAIGWALRDYARTDPEAVRHFVAGPGQALSGLSQREALRRLTPPSAETSQRA